MAVTGTSPSQKGFPSTVNYNHTDGNLTDRGYPSSMEGFQGYTGGGTGGGSGSGGGGGRRRSTPNNVAAYTTHSGGGGYSGGSNYNAAYEAAMAALNAAFENQMSALSANLESTKGVLLDNYNRSKKNINDDAAKSLKQAYINKMISQRNLGQQMSAQGLNGGATETTLAGMQNTYGNARNNINTTTSRNLSDLEGNYNNNLAQALQAYNTAVAQAQMQRASIMASLAARTGGISSDYGSVMSSGNDAYMSALKEAVQNGQDFTFDPTEAINTVKAQAVQQTANPLLSDSNYAAWQDYLNKAGIGQANNNVIPISYQQNPQLQNNYISQILSQLAG